MKLRVKICGITNPEQAQAIVQLGATALGFICAPQSPRYVTPEQIGAIAAQLPRHPKREAPICDRIGVFVNASLEVIANTVTLGNLNGVQLHGDEPPQFCQQVRTTLPGVELIKALRIKTPDALDTAIAYQEVVHTLLLDAYHPNLHGGTGKTLDWQRLQQFRPTCPWFLAGGLTPDNILDALRLVHPDGIDLSSRVERAPGDKDLEQVARLFQQLRAAS
jgi:phosphoribosylanthranilate isomerase